MKTEKPAALGGLAAWILARCKSRRRTQPRLALLERISLAPRQTLSLVEAEGRRLLIASSPEGAPAFYPLDGPRLDGPGRRATTAAKQSAGRISW
jgi:flagellar biogenesis protein FliO